MPSRDKTTDTAAGWQARLLRGGIRFRIFLLVLLIILPFAALLGWDFHERYGIRRSKALQSELEIAQSLGVSFNAYLGGIRKQSLSLGHAIRILPPAHEEQIRELLMTAADNSSSLRNISWVSPEGMVITSSASGFGGLNLSRREFFRKIAGGQDFAVEDLAPIGVLVDLPTVVVATGIRDFAGVLRGIVMASIEPNRLNEVALPQERPEDGSLALFDRSGTLVYHSRIKEPSWEQRTAWKRSDAVLGHVLRTGRQDAEIQHLELPHPFNSVCARVPIPGIGWVAGAGQPADVAFAEVRQGTVQDAVLGSVVFALAFLLAYLLGRNISAPLRRLEEDAHLMAEGTVITRSDSFAPEEVRRLRDTMLSMTEKLLRRAAALRESESSLQVVLNNVYDGILIHDLDGRIAYLNDRSLEMFRISREEARRLTILDLAADPEPAAAYVPTWREVLAGQTKFFEWHARRPDNTSMDLEVFLCHIPFQGQDLIMASVRDITERKRVARELQQSRDELELRVRERTEELSRAFEQLKEETEQRLTAVESLRRQEQLLIQQSRLAAMGEMMVNISHQWRQPLNIVGLIVQELAIQYEQGNLTPQEMAKSTEKVMDVVAHMSRTIDDFRKFFSPDKTKTRFSTKDVVERVLYLLEGELKELNVSLEVSCEQECRIDGFPNEYMQVILNIVTNARDVLRERKVAEPRIAVRLFDEGGRSVVAIADNGGGIAADVMERIFDPYFTTKGPDRGTGIGLFMSKNIIEKSMGGTLSVRNTSEGAEFRIAV